MPARTSPRVLAETRPDVFAFCTPPQVRLPLVRAGVEAGVKLIAYEKPMAASTNEALEIDKLLREAGVKSVVSHQHRYGEHYRKVKEIIASGAIGRVHTVYGHATGWMMHMMTHLIDYVRWYNDHAEAEWVMGQAAGREKFADVHASPDYIAGADPVSTTAFAASSNAATARPTCPKWITGGASAASARRAPRASPRS